jgi:hypothetical protein
MSPMSGTGHVIDDFIDTHPDEAFSTRPRLMRPPKKSTPQCFNRVCS